MSVVREPQWWEGKAEGQNEADRAISNWIGDHKRLTAVAVVWIGGILACGCMLCRLFAPK